MTTFLGCTDTAGRNTKPFPTPTVDIFLLKKLMLVDQPPPFLSLLLTSHTVVLRIIKKKISLAVAVSGFVLCWCRVFFLYKLMFYRHLTTLDTNIDLEFLKEKH